MERPSPPTSLPKYLAEGLPKQDTETLRDVQTYLDALIEYRTQPVDENELPETADPVEEPDDPRKGTVVKEKVKCGDDSCKCVSGNSQDMHGPYLYRYYREDGTMKSEYVGKP
jgi:hypothetical protein